MCIRDRYSSNPGVVMSRRGYRHPGPSNRRLQGARTGSANGGGVRGGAVAHPGSSGGSGGRQPP
eukprot:14643099-Alexandrium_andersonii.AAC.1